MHSYGIIHGDLKMENLMFIDKEMSDIKLIDYGLATKIGTNSFGGNE